MLHWPSVRWGLERISSRELAEWAAYFEVQNRRAEDAKPKGKTPDEMKQVFRSLAAAMGANPSPGPSPKRRGGERGADGDGR